MKRLIEAKKIVFIKNILSVVRCPTPYCAPQLFYILHTTPFPKRAFLPSLPAGLLPSCSAVAEGRVSYRGPTIGVSAAITRTTLVDRRSDGFRPRPANEPL